MADILGREQTGRLAGTFSADKVKLSFGGTTLAGTATQSIGVQYQSPVTTIFELGSADRYYIVGRASGQATIGQILGPSLLTYELLSRLGDPCAAGDRALQFEVGICRPRTAGVSALVGGLAAAASSGAVPLTMEGCISMGININTEAQQVLIQQQVSLMFASMYRR